MRTHLSTRPSGAGKVGLTLVVAALVAAGCASSANSGGTPAGGNAGGSAGATGKAAAVQTAKGAAGTYLADGTGRALYLWRADAMNKSSCSSSCTAEWPPLVTTGKPTAGGGAQAADLGTFKRADGSTQVTYKGHPLYYFAGDNGAGQTNGQGLDTFGAVWYLVAPSGTQITAATNGGAAGSAGTGGY